MEVYNNVLELIGNTPIVRMQALAGLKPTLLAKLEMFNPGNSSGKTGIGIKHDTRRGRARLPAARGGTYCGADIGNTPAQASRLRLLSSGTSACSSCPTRCRKRRFRS